ncbi:MAG: hypothetical protein RDU25_00005 [Patescibacteria group bacterium]|nr:hypothetical protein [Patescibacteria group bacterium]
MAEKSDSSEPSAIVFDLSQIREDVGRPTRLMSWLVRHSGRRVLSQRPGRVEAGAGQARHTIRVTLANPFEREAVLFHEAGEPVPQHVLEDIKRWQREHGRD